MFISKSTHSASLVLKDAEIATLRSEVAFLRSLVEGLTVSRKPSLRSETASIEANAVLSGDQEQIDLHDFSTENDQILAEREAVLSGTY